MQTRVLITIVVGSVFVFAQPISADPVKPGDKAKKPAASKPAEVEVRLVDNSTLKGVLLDDKIEIHTRYGKLSVPARDIQSIDFVPRPTPELTQRIDAAIAALAGPNEKQREAAVSELISLREMSYPALTRAGKSSNQELAARARDALERLREALGDDKLSRIHDHDVIQTEGFTIVGRVETPTLRARTNHFGELQLKVADLRGVRSLALALAEVGLVNAEADPGTLVSFEQQLGKTFHFRVTGAANGSLWGTEVYTTDSNLAAAAVHSGILKLGQTGIVKVTILASPPAFLGSTQNGLTSSGYGAYRAAYKVSKP
jgi:hypothetical protein